MKALFYDPYLDTMGGGERYMLTLVEALAKRKWQTVLLWDGDSIHKRAKSKFKLNLRHTSYMPTQLFTGSIAKRINFMRQFDLSFIISDGSIPLMSSAHNILHFQVPFHGVYGYSLFNQLKKHSIHEFVANSHFTKDVVDHEYGVSSTVIHPPVDVKSFQSSEKKENYILYVGRFSNLMQSKGHDVVIDAFKKLYDRGVHTYKLWLAGSTEVGAPTYLKKLREQAHGYPVEITEDPPFEDIQELYAKSKFFWVSTGFHAKESHEPEKCEHFGMTTVEAMASGCIPLAIRKGGFREIIQHNQNGILWDNVENLLSQTRILIKDHKRQKQLSQGAIARAQDFSTQKFTDKFMDLIME